jgi:hypothetical protein
VISPPPSPIFEETLAARCPGLPGAAELFICFSMLFIMA